MKVHTDEPVKQATETNEADYELALASISTPGKKEIHYSPHLTFRGGTGGGEGSPPTCHRPLFCGPSPPAPPLKDG